MSAEARYFRVGLFVFSGAAAITLAALVLGGGQLFQEKVGFETYFESSVQGLEVGSPVKMRGVTIGEVSKITFVDDVYTLRSVEDARRFGNHVLVRMTTPRSDPDHDEEEMRARMQEQVERGLRLRLTTSGITGTSYLEADFLDEKRFPPMEIAWEPQELYIPSAPSTLEQVSSGVERIIGRVEALDIEGVVEELRRLLTVTGDRVEALEVDRVQDEAVQLMADLRKTSEELREIVRASDLPGFSAQATDAVEEIHAAVVRIQRMMDAGRYDLEGALENLRIMSENLRELTATLREQPSLLLRSAAPEKTGEVRVGE
jgi:phospholipid/cholesterol/gamma-HCH transport system substrate-binding protein/paraquat-inducible protein B